MATNYGIEEHKRTLCEIIKLCNANCEQNQKDFKDLLEITNNLDECKNMMEELRISKCNYKNYEMDILVVFYNEYTCNSNTDEEFIIQQLFDDGWLIKHKCKWSFPVWRKAYKTIEKMTGEEKRIIDFLAALSTYVEEYYDKNLIDVSTDKWRKYGAWVLAVWWDEICETNDETAVEAWFSWWDVIESYDDIYRYVHHREELYRSCIDYLMAIKNITWNQHNKIIQKKVFIENNRIIGGNNNQIHFPDRPVENTFFYDRRFDLFYTFTEIFSIEKKCSFFCMKSYCDIDQETRKQYRQLLSIPCLYLDFFFVTHYSELWSDCFGESDLYVMASIKLWDKLKNIRPNKAQIISSLTEEVNSHVFGILENQIMWAVSDDWKNVIKDLIWYFVSFGSDYCRSATQNQKYVSNIHQSFIRWYSQNNELRNHCRDTVLFFLMDKYNSNHDGGKKIRFFSEYIILADIDNSEETNEKAFKFYKKFIHDNIQSDTILSTMEWGFWKRKPWEHMMEYLIPSKDTIVEEFCKILSPDKYRNAVIKMSKNSPVLNVGKAGIIHLQLMTIPFLKLKDSMSKNRRDKLAKEFTNCFIAYQNPDCDPFEVESNRILEADFIYQKCMEVIPTLDEEFQNQIIMDMEKQSVEKIIMFMKHAKNEQLFERLSKILTNKVNENFTEHVYFFPTWQNIINIMIDLCHVNDNFEKAFTDKTIEVYEDFKKAVIKRGIQVKHEYEKWMNSVDIHVKILLGNEEDVLQMPDDELSMFYKAWIYLNRNNIQDLKQADSLYSEYISIYSSSYAPYVNRFIAAVRICTHKDIGAEKKTYFELAEKYLVDIEDKFDIKSQDTQIIYSNILFLYEQMECQEKFWQAYYTMPAQLYNDISCARYVVSMYMKRGDSESAKGCLKQLEEYYGESNEIIELKAQLYKNLIPNVVRPDTTEKNDHEIQDIINAMRRLLELSDYAVAKVYMKNQGMENVKEAQLLLLMMKVTEKVQQYSDYVMFDGKTADENTYNKMIEVLFNQNQKEVYDYYMLDQTQEGTATNQLKTKRQSVGSLDLVIKHKDQVISIVEGILLKSINKKVLKQHIQKVFGYNYMNVETVFLTIYADNNNIEKLWTRYLYFLQELADSKELSWEIKQIAQKQEIEIFSQKIYENGHVCMTKHVCQDKEIHMFHIMIDIKKATQKIEAERSHGMTK